MRLVSTLTRTASKLQHKEYRKPFWAARGPDGQFELLDWNPSLRRIMAMERFKVQTMVLVG